MGGLRLFLQPLLFGGMAGSGGRWVDWYTMDVTILYLSRKVVDHLGVILLEEEGYYPSRNVWRCPTNWFDNVDQLG